MTGPIQSPIPLTLCVQKYAWGKKGADSLVARLADVTPDPEETYAELWIGAHPNAPAGTCVEGTSRGLDSLISTFPNEVLGYRIAGAFDNRLPFLAKALSVGAALSIQTHPTRQQAEVLHQQNPAQYPDRNHKPEIAVALTTVELLVSFQSDDELRASLTRYPEIQKVLSQDSLAAQEESRKTAISLAQHLHQDILNSDSEIRAEATTQLVSRLQLLKQLSRQEQHVIEMLRSYGAADVGILTSLLMKYVELPAGSAIFIEPNTLHAYLSGDLVECMANSDNVVRAGLTRKFQDIPALLSILNYQKPAPGIIHASQPTAADSFSYYGCSAAEFRMAVTEGSRILAVKDNTEVAVYFLISGTGSIRARDSFIPLHPGTAVLIPARCSEYELEITGARLFRFTVP